MTVLSMLAIAFSVGAIALCAHIDFLHMKDDETMSHLLEQHTEIMRHMTNCMGLLEQRIKKLEEEKNHEERN